MSKVILPKDFNVTRLGYGPPKQLDSGGKSIFIKYDVWKNERSDGLDKDVSFQGMEGREGLKMFFNMLEAMETRLVADAYKNSTAWFKKRFPSLEVEALFTPLVKAAKDRNKYPPTFKMTHYDDRKRPINRNRKMTTAQISWRR